MQLRLIRALMPGLASLVAAEGFFASGKAASEALWGKGFFKPAAHPDLYLYRIADGMRSYLGVVGGVAVRHYLEGTIRGHERTLPGREQIQRALLGRRRMAIKPVLLTHPAVAELDGVLHRAAAARPADSSINWNGERHAFWSLNRSGQRDAVVRLFADRVPLAYIADGHHRSAAMAQLFQTFEGPVAANPFGLMFTALFSGRQLAVYPFHRVVSLDGGSQEQKLWGALQAACEAEALPAADGPKRKHELTVFRRGRWYRLRWRPGFLRRFSGGQDRFDAHLLDDGVLGSLGGDGSEPGAVAVQYIEGPRGLGALEEEVLAKRHAVGLCLYPVALEDVMRVADAGKVLPPKSTWFAPRMKNGLIGMQLTGGRLGRMSGEG